MNPITPQQLGDHISLRRRDLAHEFSANRARRAGRGGATPHRRRPATILATAAVGAAAFLAGGLLDTEAVSARPPAPKPPVAEVTVATHDCVARPRTTQRPTSLNPRTHEAAPRHLPIAV